MKPFALTTTPLWIVLTALASDGSGIPDTGSGADTAAFELRLPLPEGIRPAPFQAGVPKTVLNASDFGAIPDDGQDDTPAIQAAVETAIRQPGMVELRFNPGCYDLIEPPADSRHFIQIRKAEEVLLSGNGAEWIAHDPATGIFRIEDSQRIEIRDLTIDYDPLPWTEGTVVATDPVAGSMVLEAREGFPRPDADYFTKSLFWGYALDPEVPGRLRFGTESHSFFEPPAEPLGGGRFRLAFKRHHREHASRLDPGDRFTLLARVEGRYTAFVENSHQITFTRLTTYASVSGHYIGVRADAINLLGCRALIREGRWKGGNADTVHIQTARIGPWVEGCHFEGISDDSLVVYTRPYALKEILSPRSMRLERLVFGGKKRTPIPVSELKPGDRLDFYDPNENAGFVRAIATVKAYDANSGRVEFEESIENTEQLSEAGPSPIQIFNRAHGRGYVMRDNRVQNSRRYGLYVKAGNGLVENNHFEGLSSKAIAVFNEPAAPNGGFAHDLTLQNNRIVGCGFSSQYLRKPGNAVFSVYAKRKPYAFSTGGTAHGDIVVRDNQVTDWITRPFYLANIDGLRASGNRWGPPRETAGHPPAEDPFRIVSSEAVEATDNGPIYEKKDDYYH